MMIKLISCQPLTRNVFVYSLQTNFFYTEFFKKEMVPVFIRSLKNKSVLCALFLSLHLFGFASETAAQPDPVRGDSLQSTFYLGPADLFWQTGFHNASLDRMSFQFNSGHYGFYGPQPKFILNDIPFDPSFFGVTFSQFIPEPFSRIEEISVKRGLGLHQGEGYVSGMMHLKSEPMKEGVSLFVSGQYGHNGGEPGPWVFDPNRVTPNVERFGPWLDAGIGLKFGRWYAKGTMRTHSNKNVDEFVQMRTINLRGIAGQNEFLSVENTATLGMIETGFESDVLDLKLQATRAESSDYLYFQPLAREIPTRLHTDQYSALARISVHEHSGFRLIYQYREKKTEYRRNRFIHSLDWNQQMHIFRGAFYYDGSRTSTEAGAEHQLIKTDAIGLEEATLNPTRLFLEQWLNITGSVELGTVQQAVMRGSEFAVQSSGTIRLKPGSRWTLEFEGGYSELFPEIANQTDYWVSRGYEIYDHLEMNHHLPETLENTRKIILSNRQFLKVAEGFQVEAELEWMRHLALNIPFQQTQYALPFSTIPGGYTVHGEERGSRYQLRVSATHILSEQFNQNVDFYYNRTVDGNEIYRQYWTTIPEFLVQYQAGYKPYSDVAVNVRLQYRSETEWAEFENLDGELNRTFHVQYPFQYYQFSNRLPEHVRLDLSASKWFWAQRLRLTLTLKNLLNENFQTYPIGTREGFGYFVRLDMRF